MAAFRKKPIIVQAVRWAGRDDTNRIINWLSWNEATIGGWLFHDTDITIPTLEGAMKAMPGDWIIRGVKGEFYPIKDDIFRATYDEVANA